MVFRNFNRRSECCDAAMYDDSDICPECKEHCEIQIQEIQEDDEPSL